MFVAGAGGTTDRRGDDATPLGEELPTHVTKSTRLVGKCQREGDTSHHTVRIGRGQAGGGFGEGGGAGLEVGALGGVGGGVGGDAVLGAGGFEIAGAFQQVR